MFERFLNTFLGLLADYHLIYEIVELGETSEHPIECLYLTDSKVTLHVK